MTQYSVLCGIIVTDEKRTFFYKTLTVCNCFATQCNHHWFSGLLQRAVWLMVWDSYVFQDARRDRSLQISTERGDTDKVYQTIGAPERARSPAKSILKKSSTNPDLLSEVKRQSSPGSPIRDRSPNRAGKSKINYPLKKLIINFNKGRLFKKLIA